MSFPKAFAILSVILFCILALSALWVFLDTPCLLIASLICCFIFYICLTLIYCTYGKESIQSTTICKVPECFPGKRWRYSHSSVCKWRTVEVFTIRKKKTFIFLLLAVGSSTFKILKNTLYYWPNTNHKIKSILQ